jgi:hypothetical protein
MYLSKEQKQKSSLNTEEKQKTQDLQKDKSHYSHLEFLT